MGNLKAIVVALGFAALALGAETAPTNAATPTVSSPSTAPNQTVTATAPSPAATGIFGTVDLRPGYKSTVGTFNTEDYAQLGYRFTTGNTLTFRQEFTTNLYDAKLSPGMNAQALDGSFRLKLNNLSQDRASGTSFSLEPRVYLPTNALKRDAGMITALRTYFKFKKSFSPTSYFQIQDSPILHVYDKVGAVVAGKSIQNPDVENRFLIEFESELGILTGLSLYLPLEIASQHVRGFGSKAGTWGHKATFWPELTYPVTKQVRLGVAFRTDNLIKPDFSGLNVSDAFRLGVTQAILNATL